MDTLLDNNLDEPPLNDAEATPFSQVFVTITKQDYIQLVCSANYWQERFIRKSIHARRLEEEHDLAILEAAQRERDLRAEVETLKAQNKALQKLLFSRKSERGARKESNKSEPESKRKRGQQPNAPSHGRNTENDLPVRTETIEVEPRVCPCCGLEYVEFPGTEDCEVIEIEVSAYRRFYRRKRLKKACRCQGVAGIVTAPPPNRLINRGKYGISVWVEVLLSKYLHGQPSYRLTQELANLGLNLPMGTLTGGLKAIAPLFEPIEAALIDKLRSGSHWHADETRWEVFVEVEGKIGRRWFLWVFQSKTVVHFTLDPKRSADVPNAELGEAVGGIINCDRYSAYKSFARQHSTFTLAFCWAHQRRDFLELANSYPDLRDWVSGWIEKIGGLYHLNNMRVAARDTPVKFEKYDRKLRQAMEKMRLACEKTLAKPKFNKLTLEAAAVKVLQSMHNHWEGLNVFVDHPTVPMDNNKAERSIRVPVVGRKGFYGSGSLWSGALAAGMYSILMTLDLWGINQRTWLNAYLQACAENNNQPPPNLEQFLPWTMTKEQLAVMKGLFASPVDSEKELDSS
jgi:transposase